MPWIHAFALPKTIPAEGVELLRHLLSDPTTPEVDLEQWLRRYPQVVNSSPEGIFPKTTFRLPGESEKLWTPDLLYREVGSEAYDVIELKKVSMPLLRGQSDLGVSRWSPSSPPRPSSQLTHAMGQLELYLMYSHEYREQLERDHGLCLYLPKGTLVGGTSPKDDHAFRFVQHQFRGVQLMTWTTILTRAQAMIPERLVIAFPCVPSPATPTLELALDSRISRVVSEVFYDWTGFFFEFINPMIEWQQLLENANREVSELEDDGTEEGHNIFSTQRGRILEIVYYRLGKYCPRADLRRLLAALPDVDNYISRRSFVKLGQRIKDGFEDTQKWMQLGREASSVSELESVIRRALSRPKDKYTEPWAYYPKTMTLGFLEKHLLEGELSHLLRIARWTNE
ncbi:MAG: DUF4263 domain-containing protein [Acidobacteriia bacterium]|nr:DUF4263 domain-containing protein [Terriglobia bacterium]